MTFLQSAANDVATECHRVAVSRFLQFLGCPGAALEDTTQEVLLAGLRTWPRGEAPKPWLFATARNQLRKLLRARGACRELADLDHLNSMWHRHIDDSGNALQTALRQCLAKLPARSRAVLHMRYGENLDRTEIGVRIGLGVEGVKSLLVRLRDGLERCIRGRMRDE
ncbi:MAG TPA: sigma-70 family RNA polymerase sigma factor [Planctomycetes bacterium]|nr:sigma-70 family RNA polymerase sigma factor [Planctomycetota bacterium]